MTLSLLDLAQRLSRKSQFGDDPFRFLRGVVGGLLLAATVVAVLLAVTGIAPQALLLVGAIWAIYGIIAGVLGGILEPLLEAAAQVLPGAGLNRMHGFSAQESLKIRGNYSQAAEGYLERAKDPRHRVAAMMRRAALLAGPLASPQLAAAELEELRSGNSRMTSDDEVSLGMALVDLYDYRLGDPGRAMAELRRLIDRYPESRHVRRMRQSLRRLKQAHFGEAGSTLHQ